MNERPPVEVPDSSELREGQTVVFPIELLGRQREAFLLRHGGRLHAFLNECPHWAVELDLGDGHFFDEGLGRIYCKNHGALFHPETGVCETGPCLGRALTRFAVHQEGERVTVDPTEVLP